MNCSQPTLPTARPAGIERDAALFVFQAGVLASAAKVIGAALTETGGLMQQVSCSAFGTVH